MPVDPRHLSIARIVLTATSDRYPVALGGGNSLILHGLSNRFTEDVDFFVKRSPQVDTAAAAASAALERAGYAVSVTDKEYGHVELLVHPEEDPSAGMKVEFAHFTYGSPVQTDAGPTVPPDDGIRNKVSALFTRMAVRDYVDLAHILAKGKHTLPQLIEMTMEIDGLSPEAIADAGQHLATISDRRIERYLNAPGENGQSVRKILSVLPETPEQVLDLMGWEKWPDPPAWTGDDDGEWPA